MPPPPPASLPLAETHMKTLETLVHGVCQQHKQDTYVVAPSPEPLAPRAVVRNKRDAPAEVATATTTQAPTTTTTRATEAKLPAVCTLHRNDNHLVCSSGEQNENLIVEIALREDAVSSTDPINTGSWFDKIRPQNVSIVGPMFSNDLELLFTLNFTSVEIAEIKGFSESTFDLSLLNNFTNLQALSIGGNYLDSILPGPNCNLSTGFATQDACAFPLGAQITTLDLQRNVLADLSSDFFLLFPNLQVLDWSRNHVRQLTPATFEVMPRLRRLSLTHNLVEDLPADIFAALTQLQQLQLQENAITHVHEHCFRALSSLQHLDLSDNPLAHLPPTLFAPLTALTELRLDRARVGSIDTNLFEHNTMLQLLRLTNNQLTTLPASALTTLTRLERLFLNDNGFEALPGGLLSPLTNLLHLSIRRNKVTRVAASDLAALTRLQHLALEGNPLHHIPEDLLTAMPNLLVLDLHGCDLSSVPPTLFQPSPGLSRIVLAMNNLDSFASANVLRNLTSLDLSGNSLTRLPNLAKFPNVQFLRLGGHHIPQLDLLSILTLPKLASVDMSAAAGLRAGSEAVVSASDVLPCLSGSRVLDDHGSVSRAAVHEMGVCLEHKGVVVDEDVLLGCLTRVAANGTDSASPFNSTLVLDCMLDALHSRSTLLKDINFRNLAFHPHVLSFIFSARHFALETLALGWPGLTSDVLPPHHICNVLGSRVEQLTITNTGYTTFTLCQNVQFDSLFLNNNTRLAAVEIGQPVRQVDLSGCTSLVSLQLPSAEILDLSFTRVADTVPLCSQWGKEVLIYRGVQSQHLRNVGPRLLRRCAELVGVADFSNNPWLDQLRPLRTLMVPPVVLARGRFRLANTGLLATRKNVPLFTLLQSPIQCRLDLGQQLVQRVDDAGVRPVPEQQLAISFDCSCANGFRLRGGVCEPEPAPVELIATTTTFAVLVAVGAAFVLRQWRRRVVEQRKAAEREKRLEALESSWSIDYQDLVLMGVLGAGTYGQVMKADWDGLTVAVKEINEAVRIFDTGSENEFQRESEFLQKTRHPNVVRFFGSGHKPDGSPFMVLEYMALGSLYDLLRPREGSFEAWFHAWRSQAEQHGEAAVDQAGSSRLRSQSSDDTDEWAHVLGGGQVAKGGPLSMPLLENEAGAMEMGMGLEMEMEMTAVGTGTSRGATKDDGRTPPDVCSLKMRLARDVACGMSFIHSLGKVHRCARTFWRGGGGRVRERWGERRE